MLDYEAPVTVGFILNNVFLRIDILPGHFQNAFQKTCGLDQTLLTVLGRIHLYLQVERITQKLLLSGRQVPDPSITGVGIAVKHGDRPLHHMLIRGIAKKHPAQRISRHHLRVEDTDPLGRHVFGQYWEHG